MHVSIFELKLHSTQSTAFTIRIEVWKIVRNQILSVFLKLKRKINRLKHYKC